MIELTASAELLGAMQAVASAFDRMATAFERYTAPGAAPAAEEAAASPPPPPPPTQWTKPGHWCTPERKDVLRRLYPTAATRHQIRDELDRCAGGDLPSWDHIVTYCNNVLKIQRPRPVTDPTPVIVDATSLRIKAAAWGILDDHDTTANVLLRVNEKAARIGHRPYELQQRSR